MKSSLIFSLVLLSSTFSQAAMNAPFSAPKELKDPKSALPAFDSGDGADSDIEVTEQNRLELKRFLQEVAEKPSEPNRSPAVLGPAVDEMGKVVLIKSLDTDSSEE